MKSRLDIVGGITWMMWLINHPESSKLIRKGRAYAGIYKARLDKNRKKILALLSELNFNNPNLADSVFTLIQISMMRSTLDNGNRARKELLKCCIEYNEILCDLLVDENISFHPQVYKSISSLTKSKDEVVIRK
ncbi:MAG: hypothetical protein Q4A27_03005 [bacterium]|nr:hypothetical protein [bacterium]